MRRKRRIESRISNLIEAHSLWASKRWHTNWLRWYSFKFLVTQVYSCWVLDVVLGRRKRTGRSSKQLFLQNVRHNYPEWERLWTSRLPSTYQILAATHKWDESHQRFSISPVFNRQRIGILESPRLCVLSHHKQCHLFAATLTQMKHVNLPFDILLPEKKSLLNARLRSGNVFQESPVSSTL